MGSALDALYTTQFQLFWVAILFFHLTEFLAAWTFMHDTLSWRSWLISRNYVAAHCLGLLEYLLEWWLFGRTFKVNGLWIVGLLLVIVGESLRKAAILTARHNFTHAIQYRRRPQHHLITHGIYSFVRHPGYLGWMIWAVGTQLLLCNPICTCLFYYISQQFFRSRIAVEEDNLVDFFGTNYESYRQRVPTYIPGIA